MTGMLRFEFYSGPWENSDLPTIVRDCPDGGDPHILAVLKQVHNPDALYELCRFANEAQRGTSAADERLIDVAIALVRSEAGATAKLRGDPRSEFYVPWPEMDEMMAALNRARPRWREMPR